MWQPQKLQKHGLKVIIAKIVEKLKNKQTARKKPMMINIYKVKAHTGIFGNEQADFFAGQAIIEPGKAIQVDDFDEELPTNTIKTMTTLEGKPLKTENEITEHIKKIDLENTIKENKFLTGWNKVDKEGYNVILQEMSSHAITQSYADHIRKRTLQCRSNTIMTESRRYMMGYTKSPMCTLCMGKTKEPLRDTVAHRLSGCKHEQIKKMYTLRHNELGQSIAKAIKRGYKGRDQTYNKNDPCEEWPTEPGVMVDVGIDPEGIIKSTTKTIPTCLITERDRKTIKKTK